MAQQQPSAKEEALEDIRKMFNNIDWFDDIFSIVNEEEDEDDDAYASERILEEYYQDYDFNSMLINYDKEDFIERTPSITEEKPDIEEGLSQQLSQLSTHIDDDDMDDDQYQYTPMDKKRQRSTPTSQEHMRKRIRTTENNNNNEREQIMDYLHTMDEMFVKSMSIYLKSLPTTVTVKDLRTMANFKYQMAKLRLKINEWTIYLNAGLGQWKLDHDNNSNINRRVWSSEIQQHYRTHQTRVQANFDAQIDDAADEEHYETFIRDQLLIFEEQFDYYEQAYADEQANLYDFNQTMAQLIDTFIEHYRLVPFQLKSTYRLQLFDYEYQDQLLEREFLQMDPTEQQKQWMHELYQLKYDYEQTKQELIEFKERIRCNQPTENMISKALSIKSSTSTSNTPSQPNIDVDIYQQELDDDDKRLQTILMDVMATEIKELEKKLIDFRRHLSERSSHYRQQLMDMPSLNDLLQRRFQVMKKRFDCMGQFRLHYMIRYHFQSLPDHYNIAKMSFSPTLIVHTPLHLFSKEHLRFLARGPSYVPPNQTRLSSSSLSSVNPQPVQQHYKQLQHDLTLMFKKCQRNLAQTIFLQKSIKDLYMKTFSSSQLSIEEYERARYEQHLLESIRQDLTTYDLILCRTADQQNVFYLGNRQTFTEKIRQFMDTTDQFEVTYAVDPQHVEQAQEYLRKKITEINEHLNSMFKDKPKFKAIYDRLHIQADQVRLPSIYFLPDVSCQDTRDMKIVPIVLPHESVTYQLGVYLDELLRPSVMSYLEYKTFQNGADFLRQFHDHIDQNKKQHLCQTTQFVCITIDHFYALVPQSDLLSVFHDFLMDSLHMTMVQDLSISTIIRLTAMFLNFNRFYYDGKIYRYVKGAPLSFRFIELLSNVYVHQIQKTLSDHIHRHNEFYGRYQHQIFFTWNQSMKEVQSLIKLFTNQNKQIHFDVKIDQKLSFMDVDMENRQGSLYSRVFRKPSLQHYTLPYTCHGDAHRLHSHWLRSALIRAVRYCTSVDDFNQERIYLEMTCLANGYSLKFVQRRLQHFFQHFDIKEFHYSISQETYAKLRHRLFNFIYEQNAFKEKQHQLIKKHQRFHLSYDYEHGPKRVFNQELRKLILTHIPCTNKTFSDSQIKLILSTKQQNSLNKLLSRAIIMPKQNSIKQDVSHSSKSPIQKQLLQEARSCHDPFFTFLWYEQHQLERFAKTAGGQTTVLRSLRKPL